MRKQMIESAAFEVATQVRAVEDAIETALAEIADLQGRMIRARATMGVATATGHEAFEQLVDATCRAWSTARGGMAHCHIDAEGNDAVRARAFAPSASATCRNARRSRPRADLRIVA